MVSNHLRWRRAKKKPPKNQRYVSRQNRISSCRCPSLRCNPNPRRFPFCSYRRRRSEEVRHPRRLFTRRRLRRPKKKLSRFLWNKLSANKPKNLPLRGKKKSPQEPLNSSQRSRLDKCERIIEKALGTFVVMAKALAQIRDQR